MFGSQKNHSNNPKAFFKDGYNANVPFKWTQRIDYTQIEMSHSNKVLMDEPFDKCLDI